jgi:hypothetical protein
LKTTVFFFAVSTTMSYSSAAMTDLAATMLSFVSYVRTLKGDEKGEAQVFCDRLFRAFGHEGYKEAGATRGRSHQIR